MERLDLINAALWPIDTALDVAIEAVDAAGFLDNASDVVYHSMRQVLSASFRWRNDLEVEGLENVPRRGGVILAANHQSWLDVQVMGAASRRRVHFIAKSEFQTWPVLRHLIRISESVFVRRGGDEAALASIVEALRQGWAVAIFPEGTIPGEEDVPRMAVDPTTGLLPGHTGVARLALRAGVPIVPVGISGTGRAFPPEVYPRLEILRLPAGTPIRVRFGKAIRIEEYREGAEDRSTYRALTDRVMREISNLVDHRCNYVPIDVPLPQPPASSSIGVLLLHGFAAHPDSLLPVVSVLEQAGIRCERPVLRGHGTRYQDLRGVRARDWFVDAQRGLIHLCNFVDRVVVVGFSLGGLVALDLAMRHPDKIAGVVSAAACLKFSDPLARLTGFLARTVRYRPNPATFIDPSLRRGPPDYPKFPTETFADLDRYAQDVAERLPEVHVPIRILQAKKDRIVAPDSASIIYEKVSSPHREVLWYRESGHALFQGVEADQVCRDVLEFVQRFELTPRRASAQ